MNDSSLLLFVVSLFLFHDRVAAADHRPTINLARTSIAAVSASSVNGTRAMDNRFYGVVNAFDDGNNWHDNINYSYWLANHGGNAVADVYFDVPVTVKSVIT